MDGIHHRLNDNPSDGLSSSRCHVATQTEESPEFNRAYQLCQMVIQELALEYPVDSSRDRAFQSLRDCICEILDKHAILFSGILSRFEVTDYRIFASVADELFEANVGPNRYRVTWGRIVSLFAFAVRLAQKYKDSNDLENVAYVYRYLSRYVSNHLLEFVEDNGGWEGLVTHFSLPGSHESQIVKRTVIISGLRFGLAATMFVLSLLSK